MRKGRLRDADSVARMLRPHVVPLEAGSPDLTPVLDAIGDAEVVLLGEASHGTHDFYRLRAEITKRLISEKQFCAVAAEADWPDALRVNRWARGQGEDADAEQALGDFQRFPAWMWRNADVLDFVGWTRAWNDALPAGEERAGFYGIDLYGLFASIAHVLSYLERVDPASARIARRRYACFDVFGGSAEDYARGTASGLDGCEEEVVTQLKELRRRAAEYASRDGRLAADEFFHAEQNAKLIRDAETYYRAMFRGRDTTTWNLRDTHMADTLDALRAHLMRQGASGKVVVWAHNSHLGDARATDMARRGELNVGQLVRERHGSRACLVGFTTHSGTVTAASDWDAPAERQRVRPGLPGSHEDVLHAVGVPRFFVDLRGAAGEVLTEERLERFIGVLYLAETERWSHYSEATLAAQFDLLLHLDVTRAVEPLDRGSLWSPGEPPETWPSGL